MAARKIDEDASLPSIWSDLVFTEARLLKDRNAADLAPQIQVLLERTEKIQAGQRNCWRAEIIAEAGVAAADDGLDDSVNILDQALLHTCKQDRRAPVYTRYFKQNRTSIIKMGLASQLEVVRPWVASAKTEAAEEVQQAGAGLDAAVLEGDAALREREKAASTRADHRVREIYRLIDDVNAARQSLSGILDQRASEKGLPREWPTRFFRQESGRKRKPEE